MNIQVINKDTHDFDTLAKNELFVCLEMEDRKFYVIWYHETKELRVQMINTVNNDDMKMKIQILSSDDIVIR